MIQSFDSIEQAFAAMQAAEQAANDALTADQRALRDNTTDTLRWLRVWDGLPIFGLSPSLEELVRREQESIDGDLGGYVRDGEGRLDSEEQAEYAMLQAERAAVPDTLAERRARGYLTGDCFSVVEPDGEWGDTHVSQVWPLTEAQFEMARAGDWDLSRPAVYHVLLPVLRAMAEHVAAR